MGEKKRRQSAPSAGGARFDGRLLARAYEALESGDHDRAAASFETLVANLPDDADALNAIGVLGLQLGDPGRALPPLVRAIERNPNVPAVRCHLAIAYRRLARPELAIAELEAALALDPTLAEAHSNLGNLLLERNDNAAAEASFARALALRPDYPFALFGLGEARLAQGRAEEASAGFERALALDPSFHEALYNLSRARSAVVATLERVDGAASGSPAVVASADIALESIVAALSIARDNPAYWTQFEHCVKEFDLLHPVDSRVRDLLFRALDNAAVDPARLVRPIASLVATRPDAAGLWQLLGRPGATGATLWQDAKDDVRGLLDDALLQRLLEAVVVPSLFVERLVGLARRGLLEEFGTAPSVPPSLPLSALVAMAHQCHATEYVHGETDNEVAAVAKVRDAIATTRAARNAVPVHWYGLYACYRPLHTLEGARVIADELASTALASLAIRQIREPLEEARLRETIPALTTVVDDVSAAVRSQYEANPYPRWLRVERDVAQTSVAGFLRSLFPAASLTGIPDAPARILVAGCGTGRHPIGTARRFPDSRVLAIDLSLTSLAYAERKTRELGIGNIEYRQADILALGALSERFDVVDCTGVLHHLEDPVAGWRILCSLLRPGGVMRVGLYSELARRHVVRARALINEAGFAPTPSGIRACRSAILAGQDDPLLARVAQGEDFYSLSGCRDLIFHVQEQRFTLPRIADLLADLGLDFVGFEWPDTDAPARYRARFPDDPEQTDLDRWHRFESDRPNTFVLMYQFWVRKRAGSPAATGSDVASPNPPPSAR